MRGLTGGMKRSHLIALLLMNAVWAGTYTAFKALLSAGLAPGEVVTLRFTLAAIGAMMLWPLLPGAAPAGKDLLKTAAMGVLVFAVGPRLQMHAADLGSAGDMSVVVATEPLVTALGAALLLRERVPPQRWAGFLFGMLGIIVLSGAWHLELRWQALAANLLFVSCFVCESAYSVIGKPLLTRSSPAKVVALALAWGTAANVLIDGPATVRKAVSLPMNAWILLAYLVILCTLIGYTLWYVVIREADVSLAALTILVQPMFGVVFAAHFLREELHGGQLWGMLAILAGLAVGLRVHGERA